MFVLTGPWCGLERQLGVGFVPARLDFLVLKTPFSCIALAFLCYCLGNMVLAEQFSQPRPRPRWLARCYWAL